jgi:hypothetical protein
MKRLFRTAAIALALGAVSAPAFAEVKTRDKVTFKFESRLLNFIMGKAAKEGVENKVAVKGNRKATISGNTGTIIDLSEEKVYDLDMKKKTYTVTTFEELRRRAREAAEKAEKESQKEEPGQAEEPKEKEKPAKEYEFDFDVKETGQTRQIAGYNTRQTIATVTVREKGKTLEEGGGMVMINDLWLAPEVPQLKELFEFDMKYAQALSGPQSLEVSAEQMAQIMAVFPMIGKATERMEKDGAKYAGTALDTTITFETVKSKEQFAAAEQQQQSSGGGGIGGLLAKKVLKQGPPKQRSTVMTSNVLTLELATSVDAADLAIPADFKEKK